MLNKYYLIMIIDDKLELAMDVMETLKLGQDIQYNKHISDADRRIMKIDKEALNKAVVIPYYSSSYNGRQVS
jgi:hypothetical protein